MTKHPIKADGIKDNHFCSDCQHMKNEITPALRAPIHGVATRAVRVSAPVAQSTPVKLAAADLIAPSRPRPAAKKLQQPAKPTQAGIPIRSEINIQRAARIPAERDIAKRLFMTITSHCLYGGRNPIITREDCYINNDRGILKLLLGHLKLLSYDGEKV